MKPNVVFFGPTHSGKSTLVGYLVAKTTPHFHLDNELAAIKRELGDNYKPSQSFAYLVDDTKQERFADLKPSLKDGGAMGTTIHVHTKYIELAGNAVVVFDTPGAAHRSRERLRAQYHGNVGVFVVEAGDIVKQKALAGTVEEFLAPLFTWKQLQGDPRHFVIVLSKCDKIDFDRKIVEDAKAEICKLLQSDNQVLNIVPVAIEVAARTDHNVISQSKMLSWFEGPTLGTLLRTLAKEHQIEADGDSLLFNIFKLLDLDFPGLIVEGKVLRGDIAKGDQLVFAPILFNNRTHRALTATVESIRHVKDEIDLSHLECGDVGSLKLTDLRIDGKRVDRRFLDKVSTTCAFRPGQPIVMGRILRIEARNETQLNQLDLLQHVKLLWFGRTIDARVIRLGGSMNPSELYVETISTPVALPFAGEQLSITDLLLLIHDRHFIQATIKELGEFSWLRTRKAPFSDYLETFSNLEFKEVDETLVFEAQEAESIVRKLLRVSQRLQGEAHLSADDYDIGLRSDFLISK